MSNTKSFSVKVVSGKLSYLAAKKRGTIPRTDPSKHFQISSSISSQIHKCHWRSFKTITIDFLSYICLTETVVMTSQMCFISFAQQLMSGLSRFEVPDILKYLFAFKIGKNKFCLPDFTLNILAIKYFKYLRH